MRKIQTLLITIFAVISFAAVSVSAKTQDIQIYTADNSKGNITKESVEEAFKKAGFAIDGNNNMNTPFKKRFNSTWYETYRLLFVHNPELVAKLAKNYPSIGLISPLSTSVYSNDKKKTMNISTLTLEGMSKITGIPTSNKDLQAIYAMMNNALKAALPNGHFQKLNYKIKKPSGPLVTTFVTEIEVEEGVDLDDARETFQEELEGEIEPVGFIVAGFVDLNEEFRENGVNDYDFYDAYSICKLEVIHPVSKTHPEVGAFAPCTLYMYKKKGESETHMGFPSVQNWISSTDIEDDASLKPLLEAQKLLEDIITEVSE
jgi:uncharacterized protein (DUF302 family)